MSRLSVFLVGVLWIALLCCCPAITLAQGNTTNKGTEFWTAWMDHISGATGASASNMVLYITSDVSTTGSVDIADGSFSQSFTVTANQITFVDIPASAFLGSEGKYVKGIHITSAKPIVVYAHIYASSVSGATLVLPVSALAKDYYSINYTQRSNSANSFSSFDVIATEDNTTVEITPTADLLSGHKAGTAFNITLNKGEVYQGLSTIDLTRTRIRSISNADGACKRIAVYAGSSKLYIGCPAQTSDNLFQQVYPTASWGKNYVTVPTAGRAYDVFRIVYSDATANVTVNGSAVSATNGYYEFNSSESNVIKSDKAIQVVQYAVTQTNTLDCKANTETIGDPEMIYLTPIEQGLDHVTLYSTNRYQIVSSYINVIIPTSAASSFTLDGASYTRFTPVSGNTAYSYAQIKVSAGTHTIAAADIFNAIAYGFGRAESYGYAAGTNLKDLNQYLVLDNTVNHTEQTSGCSDESYNLKVTIPYQTTSIKWDLKDGSAVYTDNAPKVVSTAPSKDGTQTLYTYQYSKAITFAAGEHTVIASVFNPIADECGSYDDVEFDFTVADPPVAKFTPPKVTCLGDSSVFADASSSPLGTIKAWLWDFGDGQTSALQNPAHLYAKAGDYKVVLTTTNDAGCATTTTPQNVHVSMHPVAAFTLSAPDCATKAITFTDNSTTADGTITNWLWDFGDGTAPETHTSKTPFTHIYAAAGTYTIKLQVTNSNGCVSDYTPLPVTINPLPVAAFTTPDVCLSDAFAQFQNTSTINNGTIDDLTYLWNFGDPNANAGNPNTSTEKNPKHRYTQVRDESNPYHVSLTVTSKSGCVSVTTQKDFTVNGSTPKAALTIIDKNGLCSSNAVIFDASKSTVDFGSIVKIKIWFDYDNNKADTASFYKSKNQIPADGKFSHFYKLFNTPLTKSYHVYMEVYSGIKCFDMTDQLITINANPKITVTSPGIICQNAGTVQIATAMNGFTGTGTFTGSGVSSLGMFNPANVSPGTYTLNYHFTAANTCGFDTTVQVTVKPVPVVALERESTILSGGNITLNASASISDNSRLTYKWIPATGLNRDDVLNPVASPANDTQYTLYVYSQSNCLTKAQTLVRVLQAPVVPNTFTPNGDGINDVWNIKYLDTYTNSLIEVFNRNGEKVYSSIGYPVPWDGRYKGSDLPVGTYYYIINPRNGRNQMAGWIAILR